MCGEAGPAPLGPSLCVLDRAEGPSLRVSLCGWLRGSRWCLETFTLRIAFLVALRISGGFRDSGHPTSESPEVLSPQP